ncbi:MAG: putative ribonuclease, partial [Verrucomicrobiales bacterium]|nr:putative ribonuclease [Verrucomicrobiales bacterium]
MKFTPHNVLDLFKQAGKDWSDDKAPRLGAALAYYTIFSLAPLIIIAIAIAGFVFGEDAARKQIFDQMNGLVGSEGGGAIQSMLVAANKPHQGMVATAIAVVTLLVGSTGVFIQLQDALNTVWDVKQKPGQGIKGFLLNRVLSFAMVFGIGFLLLVSLVLSAGLAAVGKYMTGLMPGMQMVAQFLNLVVSF